MVGIGRRGRPRARIFGAIGHRAGPGLALKTAFHNRLRPRIVLPPPSRSRAKERSNLAQIGRCPCALEASKAAGPGGRPLGSPSANYLNLAGKGDSRVVG